MRATVYLIAAVVLSALPASAAETLNVQLDQSAAVRLAAPARDVVIGNPAIADVSMLDARRLVVLGKSFGVTNLLVMDQAGRTIYDRQIVVSAPAPSMNYYRGAQVFNYACSDRCERLSGGGGGSAAAPDAASETP